MKQRLMAMRKVAGMAHDRRIIELVTKTANELEEDIRKLEAEAYPSIIIHIDPPPRRLVMQQRLVLLSLDAFVR